MPKLSLEYCNVEPVLMKPEAAAALAFQVVMPKPTLADMEEFGFIWEETDALPTADQLDDAVHDFFGSDVGDVYRERNTSTAYVLYPCKSDLDSNELANRLHAEGLGVAYVDNEDEDDEHRVTGFMLTGGGMDYRDHVAAAYVVAGCVPPYQTLLTALSGNNHPIMKDELIEAARQHANYWSGIAERFGDIVEQNLEVSAPGM